MNYNNQISFAKNKLNTNYNKEQKNHKKTKAAIATLVGLTAISAASIALIKSGKLKKIHKPNINFSARKITQNNSIASAKNLAPESQKITSIKDIVFEKGIAKDKNGKNFSGTIEHILENKEKVELTYQDGLIQKSKKTGKNGFIKTYLDNTITTEFNDGSKTKLFFKNGKMTNKEIYNLDDISYAEYSYYPSGKVKKTYTLKKDNPIIEDITRTSDTPVFEIKKKGNIFTNIVDSAKGYFRKKFPKKPKATIIV